MKRIISILISIILIITFMGCNKEQSNNNEKKNIFGVFKEEGNNKDKIHLILYFPEAGGKYLIPEERLVSIDKYIEETIAKEVLKGPINNKKLSSQFMGVKVLSVSGKNNILTLNLSKDFRRILLLNKNVNEIGIYSIVNSLTELPGLKKVLFTCEGVGLTKIQGIDFSKPLKRERRFFNRAKGLLPNEVLKKEMTFEKNGEWMKSYLLMSDDENNSNRKYYEQYFQEMKEVKDKGFLEADFKVGNYKTDVSGNKAKVEVIFRTKNVDKKSETVNKVYFNTVKINDVWMVDWLTGQ